MRMGGIEARIFQSSIVINFQSEESCADSKTIDPCGYEASNCQHFDYDIGIATFDIALHDGFIGVKSINLWQSGKDEGEKEKGKDRKKMKCVGILRLLVLVSER